LDNHTLGTSRALINAIKNTINYRFTTMQLASLDDLFKNGAVIKMPITTHEMFNPDIFIKS